MSLAPYDVHRSATRTRPFQRLRICERTDSRTQNRRSDGQNHDGRSVPDGCDDSGAQTAGSGAVSAAVSGGRDPDVDAHLDRRHRRPRRPPRAAPASVGLEVPQLGRPRRARRPRPRARRRRRATAAGSAPRPASPTDLRPLGRTPRRARRALGAAERCGRRRSSASRTDRVAARHRVGSRRRARHDRPSTRTHRARDARRRAARPAVVSSDLARRAGARAARPLRVGSSSENTSSSSSTGAAPIALGDHPVAGEPQRERQRSLLALRRVGARRQAVDRERRARRGADRPWSTAAPHVVGARRAPARRPARRAPRRLVAQRRRRPVAGQLRRTPRPRAGSSSSTSVASRGAEARRPPSASLASHTSSVAARPRASRRPPACFSSVLRWRRTRSSSARSAS